MKTNGEVLSEKMPLEECTDSSNVFIRVNKTGNFIAKARLTDEKKRAT
ncbi:hypothetical protein [Sporosarcina sp. P20a]|nr:hypothetical protein [Sporosarcina sp. P20a]